MKKINRRITFTIVSVFVLISAAPLFAAAQVLSDSCSTDPTVACLQSEIQQLVQILDQLLAAKQSNTPTATINASSLSATVGTTAILSGTAQNASAVTVVLTQNAASGGSGTSTFTAPVTGGAWIVYTGAAFPAGSYPVTVSVNGQTLASGTLVISGSATTALSGSISVSSLRAVTGTTQTISGSAWGTSLVGITVSNAGGKAYGSGPISVSGNSWSVSISPLLPPGTYPVVLYDYVSGTELAAGTFEVPGGTTIGTAACITGLNVSQYPSCTCPSGQTQSGTSCVASTPTSCPSGDTGTYPKCVAPSSGPSATINPPSLEVTAGNVATISGTAANASTLTIVLTQNGSGTSTFTVPVSGGTWSVNTGATFPVGSYPITVSANGTQLTAGTLTVTSNGQATTQASSVSGTVGSRTDFYNYLYSCILRRSPDTSDLAWWMSQNTTVIAAYQSFYDSAEYLADDVPNTTYVTDLYYCVLFRAPDPTGLPYWINQLNAGTSRDSVLQSFLASNEFQTVDLPVLESATTLSGGTAVSSDPLSQLASALYAVEAILNKLGGL